MSMMMMILFLIVIECVILDKDMISLLNLDKTPCGAVFDFAVRPKTNCMSEMGEGWFSQISCSANHLSIFPWNGPQNFNLFYFCLFSVFSFHL